MQRQAWLKCMVHRGMFTGELAVIIRTAEGKLISFFISSDFVLPHQIPTGKNELEGRVAVTLLDGDADYGLVALPERTIEGGRFARVPTQALSFA